MDERHTPYQGFDGAVAYVLKGYPRLSELFIASEIYRLEEAGLPLRLFVLKPADEADHHPVVDRIRAQPDYLPATTSLTATPLARWLAANLDQFRPALWRVVARRPVGVTRAALAAFAQAVRARKGVWAWPRKVYVKEFLLAVELADRVLKAPEVRHLHAHFCHGATTVTWLAAMMTGLLFSFTAHAKDLYSESLNPAGLLKRKLQAARFAVTCTEANRTYLEGLGSGAPIYRVYHGLNADFSRLLATPDRTSSKREPPARLRILGVGRLVAKKGFDLLVEACGQLREQGVQHELVIVGEDGEHSAVIRRRITELGLDGMVQLSGPMGQAALFDEYRRASVFCLPCRILDDGDRDGIPNVLMEAMACGLPIITTGISGIPELVKEGVNGMLVPAEDATAIAAAIVRLQHEPALAQRLSVAARATIRAHFDGDDTVRPLLSLFQQALARPDQHPTWQAVRSAG